MIVDSKSPKDNPLDPPNPIWRGHQLPQVVAHNLWSGWQNPMGGRVDVHPGVDNPGVFGQKTEKRQWP